MSDWMMAVQGRARAWASVSSPNRLNMTVPIASPAAREDAGVPVVEIGLAPLWQIALWNSFGKVGPHGHYRVGRRFVRSVPPRRC